MTSSMRSFRPSKLPVQCSVCAIMMNIALLLASSPIGYGQQCPNRVRPVPAMTTGILQPISWYTCPNAKTPAIYYNTEFSGEYPDGNSTWTKDCPDSFEWSDGESEASNFTSMCCPSGKVKTWKIYPTVDNEWFGRISAKCDDKNNTELDDITYGYNSTSGTCKRTLTDPTEVEDTGIYNMMASADTYQFQGVGKVEGKRNDFQCPSGLVPIGYGARSSCYSLKDFKVLCAIPQNFTQETEQSGEKAGKPKPEQDVHVLRTRNTCNSTNLLPATEPIGEPVAWLWGGNTNYSVSRTNPYYSDEAGYPQKDCCNSGHITSWHLVNATDDRFLDFFLGQISATCSDGTVLTPITFGQNGSEIDCKLVRPALTGGYTVETPSDGVFTYKTYYASNGTRLVESFLPRAQENTTDAKTFSCPNNTVAIGYSASSSCLGLTALQVLCGNTSNSAPASGSDKSTLASGYTNHSHSPGLSKGSIAGLVIGIVAALVLSAILGFYAWRQYQVMRARRRQKFVELLQPEPSWANELKGMNERNTPADSSVKVEPYGSAVGLQQVPFDEAKKALSLINIQDLAISATNPTTLGGLPSTWEIPLADVKLVFLDGKPVQLGKGSFGAVMRANVWSREVAVKMVKGGTLAEHARLLHEIRYLKACRSKHIVQFVGYSTTSDGLLLCLEFMSRGSLYNSLHNSSEHQWYNRGRQAMKDVAEGLLFLHNENIAHGALKSLNILIGSDRHVKIADLGLGKLVSDQYITMSPTPRNSLAWVPPEHFDDGSWGLPGDIWSFSTILIEVCTLKQPSCKMQAEEIKVPDEAPAGLISLIQACRALNPKDRPKIHQVYQRLEQLM